MPIGPKPPRLSSTPLYDIQMPYCGTCRWLVMGKDCTLEGEGSELLCSLIDT